MQQAVLSVLNGDHGYRKASEMYGVPKGAIERRIVKLRENPGAVDEVCKKSLGSISTVFTEEEEEELVSYVQQMEKMLFGFSSYELRKLAFELAQRNGKANTLNHENGVAGYDWYRGFMARHADKVSLRKPEATSAARAMGFNRVAVTSFFDLLENVVDKYKLSGDRIWNCDETGVSSVPKSLSKVVATKGKRQIGSVTSAERGQLVTSVICCSAAGQYMPPMLIFPRVRMKPELIDGAPPGAWAECHPSGWIQTEIFIKYMREFIQFTKASKEKPVLLILDGHAAHTKSVELIDIAREHGVILLCLPPHCTHRLQPLDVAFMKPLSTFYDHQVRIWLRNHPGRVVTQFQISSLFGQAYLQSATMLNAINGFKASGIWPMDRSIFSDADFIAAETTDIPVVADDIRLPPTTSASSHPTASAARYHAASASNPSIASTSRPPTASASSHVSASPSSHSLTSASSHVSASPSSHSLTSAPSHVSASPSSHSPTLASTPTNSAQKQNESSFEISPRAIIPFPKANIRKRVSRQRGKTAVLTSSPYKKSLLEKKEKIMTEKTPTKSKGKAVSSSSKHASLSQSQCQEEDTQCLYCVELYSESAESWVACQGDCNRWAHYSCAGFDERNKTPVFVCELCDD